MKRLFTGIRNMNLIRRVVCCILAFVCCVSVCASAEETEFSVRGGITFGLSIDEVKNIEKENGNGKETKYYRNALNEHYEHLKYENASVFGYKGIPIKYDFKDGGLVYFDYMFEGKTAFSDLEDSLISKYGSCTYSGSNQDSSLKTFDDVPNYAKVDDHLSQTMYACLNNPYVDANYKIWIIEMPDYAYLITLTLNNNLIYGESKSYLSYDYLELDDDIVKDFHEHSNLENDI